MSSRPLALAIALALSAAAAPLSAQNPAPAKPPVPADSLFPDMAGAFAGMAPMMQQMMTAQLTATLQFYAKPETADLLAQAARNYYLALMRQGFTAEQSLAIVAAWKPTASPSGR